MSRTLKFRAWDNANKIYLRRIVNISYDMAGQLHHVDGEHPNRSDITVLYDKLLLEQYTGLKDKNGKEIYEGDIVKYNDEIGFIKFDENNAGYVIEPKYEFLLGHTKVIEHKWRLNGEVIGNIHENPELLGGEE